MSEQEQLTQTLANIEADQELTPATWIGFHRIAAAALLNSPWLAEHDARIKAETLTEAADHLRNTWLGPVTKGRVYVDDKREADFRNAIRAATTELRGLADRAKEETA